MFCSMWCNANKKWFKEINIEEWGRKLSEKGIEPIWTILTEVSQACKELIKCNCRTNCMKRYRCKKRNLSYVDAVENATRK